MCWGSTLREEVPVQHSLALHYPFPPSPLSLLPFPLSLLPFPLSPRLSVSAHRVWQKKEGPWQSSCEQASLADGGDTWGQVAAPPQLWGVIGETIFQWVTWKYTSTCMFMYNTCFNETWEKEGRKKEASKVKQTRQSNTVHPRQSLFLKKNELPQVGLERTTLYTLDRALYPHVQPNTHIHINTQHTHT